MSAVGTGVGVAGNALVGGVVGVAIEASTGAMLDHYPNPVVVELTTGAEETEARPETRSPEEPTS